MTYSKVRTSSRWVLLGAAVLTWNAARAEAEVVREGKWPEADPKVSLSVQGMPRAEAVKRLADKAGWSVVVDGASAQPVDVEVKNQPASKVLELLLSDARYVAKRDGDLIAISRAPQGDASPPESDQDAEPAPTVTVAAPPPPPPSAPPPPVSSAAPAAPAEKTGDDRVVTGGSTRVEANETVHDLVVMGGSAEVLGTVTGDVTVMGGSAKVRKGAVVRGDVSVVGGSFDVDDGAKVEGEVNVVGGKARRGDQGDVSISLSRGGGKPATFLERLSDFGGSVTRTALLFVFGTVLMALATQRMEAMQGEVAARPMRTFALGIVGSLAALVAFIALCVTVVGIPIAIVALLLGVFGAYAGISATLTTVGAALVHHKSPNPYVHLAVGCALFLVASYLPWIGGFVTAGVVLFGIGTLVATRGAGFFARKTKNDGPYRTAPSAG